MTSAGRTQQVNERQRLVLAVLRKLLQRGTAPPIDPFVEERLLARLGLRASASPAPAVGDISLRLDFGIDDSQVSSVLHSIGAAAFHLCPTLQISSVYERLFLERWVSENLGPVSARWLTPQASLDALLEGAGLSHIGERRVDFLVSVPGEERLIIEIDDESHRLRRKTTDADRDAALVQAGYTVIRIPAAEVEAGHGPGLEQIKRGWPKAISDGHEPLSSLIRVPRLVHWIAFALIEAVSTGFLAGERWVIRLDNEADRAVSLALPRYLDVFRAVDELWAGGLMPQEVVLQGEDPRFFVKTPSGYTEIDRAFDGPADLDLGLEPERGPMDELPGTDRPRVVMRSAFLPINLAAPVWIEQQRVRVDDATVASGHLTTLLRHAFAKQDFREGQLEALAQVLGGRDCAVLLPTGAGKSLIYQLAGLCLPGRTLIVDPLASLMEDQIERLQSQGIDRVSTISSYQVQQGVGDQILREIASGDALFIFVSPERLQQRAFRDTLRELAQTAHINLAVVDEAHCVSEWGHDFRASYLHLGRTLRDVCRDAAGQPPPVLALTGTASRSVLRDVLIELSMDQGDERSIVRPKSFDREELRFHIVHSLPGGERAALKGLIRSLPARFGLPASHFFSARGDRSHAGIVFCPHVNGSFGILEISEELRHLTGAPTVRYSGSTPRGLNHMAFQREKREAARRFKADDSVLMVSTKAFGMGIDKPNVRYVVHFGIPGSIEAYYQEAGRAGRDGSEALCGVLLTEYDEGVDRRLLDDETAFEIARKSWANHDGQGDDITRQLFFLFNSFKGIEPESRLMDQVAGELAPLGGRRTVFVPMGSDDDDRQRALYRLSVLGVVKDYMVDWGARQFEVELAAVNSAAVVDHFLSYVRRSQPARASAMVSGVARLRRRPLTEALSACSRELLEFIYETIARSRRRSLREMWLAVRESMANPNTELRSRILEYLTQGDITPTLERLLTAEHFAYKDWLELLDGVEPGADVNELRGASGRLLTSTPDHPGLLLSRACSEVLQANKNLAEFASNLEASLTSARLRYGVGAPAVASLAEWLIIFGEGQAPSVLTVVVAALRGLEGAEELVAGAEERALQSPDNVGLSILGFASALEATVQQVHGLQELMRG